MKVLTKCSVTNPTWYDAETPVHFSRLTSMTALTRAYGNEFFIPRLKVADEPNKCCRAVRRWLQKYVYEKYPIHLYPEAIELSADISKPVEHMLRPNQQPLHIRLQGAEPKMIIERGNLWQRRVSTSHERVHSRRGSYLLEFQHTVWTLEIYELLDYAWSLRGGKNSWLSST